jgi:hypothetical protein
MTCGGVEVQLHAFLSSALDEGEWSVPHFWDTMYERYGKDKEFLSLPGIEPWLSGCLALTLVATPTKVSRLLYHIEQG